MQFLVELSIPGLFQVILQKEMQLQPSRRVFVWESLVEKVEAQALWS